jgi:hypothetical protein
VLLRPILVIGVLCSLLVSGCAVNEYQPAAKPGMPPKLVYHGAWAPIESAKIRPAVQVFTPLPAGGQAECTSNFLFRSPDNATLYLGVAAHCFGEDPSQAAAIGTTVQIGDLRGAGQVAYNGWAIDPSDSNDFGLVKIRSDPAVRAQINPSVLYFGGPVGLADSTKATPGTHVITYGHSVQRGQDDTDNPREGYILQHDGGRTTVYTDHPGIQGDSGSGLMTNDGQALGILSMGTTNPTNGAVANRDFPAVNYYVDLDNALAFAKAKGPANLQGLELVTSPLLQAGSLPLQ